MSGSAFLVDCGWESRVLEGLLWVFAFWFAFVRRRVLFDSFVRGDDVVAGR